MHPEVLQDLYLVGTDASRSSTGSILGRDRCIQKFYRIYIRYGQMHPEVLQNLYKVGTDASRSATESI